MRTVISASRRTDIPAHYYGWLIEGLQRGAAEVTQPGTGKVHTVSLRDEDVHTVVLWSKDYSRLIRDLDFWRARRLYFNFTLNDCPFLEPNVPPVHERIEQMVTLAAAFGPERINWRFDPLAYWDGGRQNNLSGFAALADRMAEIGLRRCTFSFMTVYRKTIARGHRLGIEWFDPALEQKRAVATSLADQARRRGIVLLNCCNEGLEGIANLERGRCIDGALLGQMAGEPCSLEHDRSQRAQCGCTASRDVGSYWMICNHSCSYCYANPASR